jgi:hypothetical protein
MRERARKEREGERERGGRGKNEGRERGMWRVDDPEPDVKRAGTKRGESGRLVRGYRENGYERAAILENRKRRGDAI